MPYGGQTKFQKTRSTNMNIWAGNTSNVWYWDFEPIESAWSRSGKNASTVRDTKYTKKVTFVRRWVTVPKGPRLAYKVWNPRIGRFVWAREPIRILKTFKIYSRRKSMAGLDLPPNPLSYFSVKVAVPLDDTIKGVYTPDSYRTMSGSLINAVSFRSTQLSVNFDDYCSGGFRSARMSAAIAEAEHLSQQKLYEKMGNQKVNLANMLGERRQTLSMMAEIVTSIAKALIAIKRGQLVKAFKSIFPTDAKTVANTELMYMYGIKPLLSDLDGMMEHLAIPEKQVFDVIANKSIDIPFELEETHSYRASPSCITRVYYSGQVSVRYKVRCEIALPATRHASRLGLENLPALFWELTPWSFVVDWILPVGQYLQSLDSFSGLRVISAQKTIFWKEKCVFVRDFGGTDGDGYKWDKRTVSSTITKVGCSRQVDIPVPKPPIPQFKNPVSFVHALNLLALLTQLRKS